jgi:hypothetical protein
MVLTFWGRGAEHARGRDRDRTRHSYSSENFCGANEVQQCQAIRGPGMTLWRVFPAVPPSRIWF